MSSISTSCDVATLLWEDREIFSARYQKSAAALVALCETCQEHLALTADELEFFALYDMVSSAQPEVFAKVWRDPFAYHWVRHSYQLVAHLLGGAELSSESKQYWNARGINNPREALTIQLQDFKPFALSIAYHSGQDCLLQRPCEVARTFSLPATRWLAEGSEPFRILGIQDGKLSIQGASQSFAVSLQPGSEFATRSFSVREAPVLKYQSAEIVLNPYRFDLPNFSMGQTLAATGTHFQLMAAPRIVAAFDRIDRYAPEVLEQLLEVISLIGLKPEIRFEFISTSHSELPGCFVTTPSENPWEMADYLIHEFHHNRLFFLEDEHRIFDTSHGNSPNHGEYYSPWREDLRPLHGLLHAIYVFLPVTRYWLNVYQDPTANSPEHQFACDRILRYSRQLAMGLHVFGTYAQLTPFGCDLLAQLRQDCRDVHTQIERLGLPQDAPAWRVDEQGNLIPQSSESDGTQLTVQAVLAEHQKLYDRLRQVPTTNPAKRLGRGG